MIAVRDAMHEVYRTQLKDRPEAEIKAARKELNRVYDKFVSRFGILNDTANRAAFKGDPDSQPILGLEKFDPATKTAKKTQIFTEQTLQTYRPVASVETAKEALMRLAQRVRAHQLATYGAVDRARPPRSCGRSWATSRITTRNRARGCPPTSICPATCGKAGAGEEHRSDRSGVPAERDGPRGRKTARPPPRRDRGAAGRPVDFSPRGGAVRGGAARHQPAGCFRRLLARDRDVAARARRRESGRRRTRPNGQEGTLTPTT